MEKLNLPSVCIENEGLFTKVYVNGKEIEGVTGIQFVHDKNAYGDWPKMSIELMTQKVTLKTRQVPELPEFYAPFYVAIYDLLEAGLITEDELERFMAAKETKT